MLSYVMVCHRPDQFLACTSLTVDEFDILLDSFSRAWDEYRKKNYVNSGGGKPKLPSVTDKLFFILFYYKVYPIQSAMGGNLRYEPVAGMYMDSYLEPGPQSGT